MTKEGVYQLTSEEKWNKGKSQTHEVKAMLDTNWQALDHHRLQQIRGYLNHLAEPYPEIKPYLNGFHLTIEGWRDNRDDERWRIPLRKVQEPVMSWESNEEKLGPAPVREDAPTTVPAVPR